MATFLVYGQFYPYVNPIPCSGSNNQFQAIAILVSVLCKTMRLAIPKPDTMEEMASSQMANSEGPPVCRSGGTGEGMFRTGARRCAKEQNLDEDVDESLDEDSNEDMDNLNRDEKSLKA